MDFDITHNIFSILFDFFGVLFDNTGWIYVEGNYGIDKLNKRFAGIYQKMVNNTSRKI